jgi:Family of unknown function (DUF6263)
MSPFSGGEHMVRSSTSVAVLALIGLALPVQGQEALVWKFKKGDEFFVKSVTVRKQSVQADDKKIAYENTATTYSRFVVLSTDANGTQLEQTFERAELISKDLNDTKPADPKKPADPTTLGAQRYMNLLKGAVLTVNISPTGAVKTLEGYEDLIRKLTGNPADKNAQEVLPKSSLIDDLEEIFHVLPDKAVAKGDTWTRDPLKISLGAWGSLSGNAVFTAQGKGEKGETITVTRKLTYTPPKTPLAGWNVTKADVKFEPATATIVFDAATGRLVSQTSKIEFKGTFTLTMGEKEEKKTSTSTVEQTTTRDITLVDKLPDEKK